MSKFNVRQWSERINPANFGIGRQNMQPNMPNMPNIQNVPNMQGMPNMGGMPQMAAMNKALPNPPPGSDPRLHYVFNVPFSTNLAGPNVPDILHGTRDAIIRWTHPAEAPDDVPIWELPVHAGNLEELENTCRNLSSGPLPIEAHVSTHNLISQGLNSQSERKELVTTVYLCASPELVNKSRETIFNAIPHLLQCTTVDIAGNLVCDMTRGILKQDVTDRLDFISMATGVDIFLLGPKPGAIIEGISSEVQVRPEHRWRVAIYGDVDAIEHAKTRVLIEIDKMLGRLVDTVVLESHMHLLACGRNKKNIKIIESATATAIYFPPPYTQVTAFLAKGAQERKPEEVYITGENPTSISVAKSRLVQLANTTRAFLKDVQITSAKIDSILATHVDKIRKILEANGTYLMWPALGANRSVIRVQGSETALVDKTVKEIMNLAGQFYSATWWVQHLDPRHLPNGVDLREMLCHIASESKADMILEKSSFILTGFDDAVKGALHLMSEKAFFTQAQYQIKVKIELANEHKEFVSGKKNGKINKIMGQSNVQIMFDGFNEYNFNIDVNAGSYNQLKHGLDLVEAEMPASISFHVPDQYHKRIIGIGGQHIQRIMKKHSVFVKFSNAMDRGGLGRDDDEVKVDNVICRTPARNAQNLELVKAEILDMVDQADSELTSQTVRVDRLYHRQLLMRLREIEELEKKHNCKCNIPSSEHASDDIVVKGPQWNIPRFVDGLLGMVPTKHELVLPRSPVLDAFLESPKFTDEIKQFIKNQHDVELSVVHNPDEKTEDGGPTTTILCTLTQNNMGAIRDIQDYLQSEIAATGLDDVSFIGGCVARPKSNTFNESLQFFDSKILPPTAEPDSPAKSTFEEEPQPNKTNNLAQFGRKLSSMSSLTSILDRRKGSSQSATAPFFRGSTNVSKTSLISIESTRSFNNMERNPWNDSGINLNDEDSGLPFRPFSNGNGSIHDPTKLNAGSAHKHVGMPGDMTPRHNTRPSGDSGRPSTSHSTNSGYPGPLSGPFR